jgi:serine/threonine-protein kinase
LAVARYGIDRARVEEAFQSVLNARLRGKSTELLETLVAQNLLTSVQADGLRRDLNGPHMAPFGNRPLPEPEFPAEGESSAHNGADFVQLSPSGQYLRNLGKFRLLRRLGQGGMGSVYLGYEEGEGRQVAIKVLSDPLASNPSYVERFYREAKNGAHLNHPNIVRCISVDRDAESGKHYLVLEYVDGPSAHLLLEQHGKLSVGDAVYIILDIARALEHAHSRNIIHRDIKPDNILITSSGVAKLADLGLAKRLDEESHLTALRQGFGSLYYVPYEQAFNAKQADGRSDIFALGATFYHFLTGEVPFPGSSHMEIAEKKLAGAFTPASVLNPEVPAKIDAILEKMLAREAKDRYQLVSELIVDLERTGLASPVLTFVDQDLALQDPLVRERLAAGGQPTQLDLETAHRNGQASKTPGDSWYLRFRNREGRWCKTRLTTDQVVERLQDRRISAEVEACRYVQGTYRPLLSYPEFRAFEEHHAAANRENGAAGRRSASKDGVETRVDVNRPQLLIGIGIGVGFVYLLLSLLYKLVFGNP